MKSTLNKQGRKPKLFVRGTTRPSTVSTDVTTADGGSPTLEEVGNLFFEKNELSDNWRAKRQAYWKDSLNSSKSRSPVI